MHTTLNKLRNAKPCADGWEKLLKHLGKTKADDEPLNIATIIDSNGLNDALWALQTVEGCDKELRLFAVWCARRVQHLMTDKRSIAAIDVAERFANGDATINELNAASAAASDAARAAAWNAAWAAAPAAAWNAAWNAAWDAASAAARNAARAAAWNAARAAARDAETQVQETELRRICGDA